MTNPVTYTPGQKRYLSDGLDFYKLTMGQVAFETFPNTEVTFTLKNRGTDYPLSQYIDIVALQLRFDTIREQGFTTEEITYFASLQAHDGRARFDKPYLDYLANLTLTDVDVHINPETNDLAIQSTGPWATVSLWETIVMSEVNEQYYQNLIAEQGLDTNLLWQQGDKRLDDKIAKILSRPDIIISDFGTRRRFSADWHNHVIGRLTKELPNNLIGTSNPWLANIHNLAPIGTYAHEMPMVYGAIADQQGQNPLSGHTKMMHDWHKRYGEDLSIALTDTFTSAFFFSDFSAEQAAEWRGLRHDSGDPIEFGEQALKFYRDHSVDPTTKTIVFSDGLDIDTILKLATHFEGKVALMFGWGTSLMNDLGLRANNFVMKATHVGKTPTVKLSDAEGKHTGPQQQVERYIALKNDRIKDARYFNQKVTA